MNAAGIKQTAGLAAAFGITAAMLLLLLVASAFLPQERIRENMASSADILCEREVFFTLGGTKSSTIDRYADAILLNIALPYVTEHAKERLGGDLGLSMPAYMAGAITRNLGCLFPFEYDGLGVLALLGLLLAVGYRLFVYHRPGADRVYVSILLGIALLPFLRFLILHNHSYLHHFFTYRVLMASALALGLVVLELTDRERSVS